MVSFFSLIDQSVSNLQLRANNANEATGPIAAAYNQLTNTIVSVSNFDNTYSIIDPTTPGRLYQSPIVLSGPVAVAIDPGTNTAVIVNQTPVSPLTTGTVSIVSLGAIQPFSITETSPDFRRQFDAEQRAGAFRPDAYGPGERFPDNRKRVGSPRRAIVADNVRE